MLHLLLAITLPTAAQHATHEHLQALSERPAESLSEVERGELLYHTSGCVGCHSRPAHFSMANPAPQESEHLAGGRDNPTIFGTFYAPNISPHPTDGLGAWTEDDFFRAMREGRAPDGRRYWPTFAYMAFTKMSDDDIQALWAYLKSQPPVAGSPPDHDPRFERGLGVWRALEFEPGPLAPDPSQSDAWNRGRYLVEAVSYCDQCHTPRRKTGFLIDRYYLAGGANPGKSEVHGNLTPHPEHGLGQWSEDDIVEFLTTAEKPDGSVSSAEWVMYEKIMEGYRYLSEDDKRAVATYLMALEPVDFDPEEFFEGW